MKIERTFYWFQDGEEQLTELNNLFFGSGTLHNRLLNEWYNGKKIKFINLHFFTDLTYSMFPVWKKNTCHYYSDQLKYSGSIDISLFRNLSEFDQKKFVWDQAYKYLQESSKQIKNQELYEACKYAYTKGLEKQLNPDYIALEKDSSIHEQDVKLVLWFHFRNGGVHSHLYIKKGENVIYHLEIDKARVGMEFFLKMYKSIEVKGNNIFIKGRKDVENLPFTLPVNRFWKV